MIGDDIEITIVDIRGDKVRLGITAPATIPVHRKEVYEAIQRENREASRVKMEDLPNLPGQPSKPTGKGPPMGPRVPMTRPPQQGQPGAGDGQPKAPQPPVEKKTTIVEAPADAVQKLFDQYDPKSNPPQNPPASPGPK